MAMGIQGVQRVCWPGLPRLVKAARPAPIPAHPARRPNLPERPLWIRRAPAASAAEFWLAALRPGQARPGRGWPALLLGLQVREPVRRAQLPITAQVRRELALSSVAPFSLWGLRARWAIQTRWRASGMAERREQELPAWPVPR